MSSEFEILERIGDEVALALGEGPSEDQLLLQRRDFLAVVSGEQTSRKGGYLGVAAAAAVLVATMSVVYLAMPRGENVTFWIGDDGVAGEEGQWVRTEATLPLPIHFEGGSKMSLSPSSAARMVHATQEEVKVDLSSGKIHCNINKNHVTTWKVAAGPYTIMVTGTIFNAAWQPETGNLDVDVERGAVLVSGADLGEHGVSLAVGDHLRVDGERAVISLRGDSDTEDEVVEDEIVPDDETVEDVEDNEALIESDETFGESMKPAVRRRHGGLRRTERPAADPETMSLEALWQAASKARYNRETKEAESLLFTVKRRFPNTRQAQSVNFLMGRIQLELKRNPAGAVRYFAQYLRESPNGPLAEEAEGRIIDAYKRSGQLVRAKAQARTYLRRYKNGLFADLAESVLAN